jgi:hypothetical protein
MRLAVLFAGTVGFVAPPRSGEDTAPGDIVNGSAPAVTGDAVRTRGSNSRAYETHGTCNGREGARRHTVAA